MTKKLTTLLLAVLCLQLNMYSQLIINEVLSSNATTISDNAGEFDDWIEIYNNADSAIDLAGYFISDDALDLTLYQISADDASATTVPANGYLLFWADKDIEQGADHLGIKLGAGETVTLTKPDGTSIVSSLTIPLTILEDESYGSETDGETIRKLFSQATPLESNSNSNDVDIEFSESSKLFTNSLSISLTTDGSNGNLKYTTNGAEPNINSATYTNAISINNNTVLKVAYFFNNGEISDIVTERYVKMTTGMGNANSDLPMVIIDTYSQALDQVTKKTAFMSLIEPNNNGRAYGNDEASFSTKAGIKIRGASSASFPKKQWSLELRNEDDSDKPIKIGNMEADGDWILYAPGRYDRALINNALMYEISRRLGYWAPKTQFVEVYYNEDGGAIDDSDYWGIYILTEKVELDKDRLDIKEPEITENPLNTWLARFDRDRTFGTGYTDIAIGGNVNRGYDVIDPKSESLTNIQISNVKNELEAFENALTNPSTYNDLSNTYRNLININSFAITHMLKALAKEPDGFAYSYYLFKDEAGLINSGPIWDFDRASNSPDQRSADPVGWNAGNVVYWAPADKGLHIKEMVNDPCYKTVVYDKWFDWRSNNILNTTKMNTLIDSLASQLTESYQREFTRWSSEGYTPRYGNFQGEVNELKKWLKSRSEWIDGQLIRPVTANPNGGTVNIGSTVTLNNSNNSGTIYYTVDGSDPKQNCSSTSPSATAYNDGFSINSKGVTFVKARVKQGNEWGALITHSFYVQQDYSGLVINEIHYNPKDEIFNGDTIAGTNFEFIELKNIGSSDINIAGIEFSEGITTNIEAKIMVPSGGFCVLAENKGNFQQKFGFAPDAEYSGKLSDKGEAIILNNPFSNLLDEVTYDDNEPWDVKADEGSFSLGLIDATSNNSDAANWAIQDGFTTPRAENFFCFLGDIDDDGVCDDNDQCPNDDDSIIGTNCDDGDSCTTNDVYNTTCNCEGIYKDTDNDGVCDGLDTCPEDALDICNLPTYCATGGNNTNYEYIGSITVGDLNNTTGKNNGYADFTPMQVALAPGEVYNVNLVPEFVGQAYNEYWKIWIDFNQDGDFEDANETVFTGSGTIAVSGEINIPVTVNAGATKMRISMDYSNSPTPCGNFTYGEVEDYVVFILPACTVGTPCDDSDLCTTNDKYNNDCNCIGTVEDADNDGVCDATDICAQFDDALIGTPCDDEDNCTVNDLITNDCNCAGTIADEDGDNVCDADDICADGDDNIDGDADGIPDACDTCNANIVGKPCDDGDACTIGETYDANCNCLNGQFEDTDMDTVCDAEDICADGNDLLDTDKDGIPDACDSCNTTGNSCDDEDPCTENDVLDTNCDCAGVFADADNDTICDADDICEGDDNADVDGDTIPDACDDCNNNLIGTQCDDGDACTSGETYDADCNCNGGTLVDSDNDTVCDSFDICLGDDLKDTDNDNIPNACDDCPNDAENICGIPTYCAAQSTTTNYEYIQKVSFKSIDNTSGNNNGYGDFSAQSTTISAGESVAFSLTPGFSSSSYNEAWTVWIDFNRDGDYEDAGENVYSNASTGTLSGNINIPNSVSAGATGMRVAMQWKDAPSSCGSFTYGEVEDYTVVISTNGVPKLANELVSGNISVFPNPAVNEININISEILDRVGEQKVTISIYTLNGQLMQRNNVQSSSIIQLDIQQLPNNQPYFLKVQTKSGKHYVEKFIKL